MTDWDAEWVEPKRSLLTLSNQADAFNFYVGQQVTWPPVTRWRRFVAWFKRAVLRRKPATLTVTNIDVQNGVVEMTSLPTDDDVRRMMKARGWDVKW